MNCDAVISLLDAYRDSELDARSTHEIQQHLSGCARCAAVFSQAQQFEARLTTTLKQGQRTSALWAQIEGRVVSVTPASEVPADAAVSPRPRKVDAEPPWWRFWLWPSPRCYAGLALVWLLLLVLNLSTGREAAVSVRAVTATRSTEDLAAARQRQLRAELLEAPVAARPSPRSASPQSHRAAPAGVTSA